MKRLFLALAILASMAQSETRFPADHWCLAGPPEKTQPKAHECHCVRTCDVDDAGNVTPRESTACAMYCVKNRCMCHTDADDCKPPKG